MSQAFYFLLRLSTLVLTVYGLVSSAATAERKSSQKDVENVYSGQVSNREKKSDRLNGKNQIDARACISNIQTSIARSCQPFLPHYLGDQQKLLDELKKDPNQSSQYVSCLDGISRTAQRFLQYNGCEDIMKDVEESAKLIRAKYPPRVQEPVGNPTPWKRWWHEVAAPAATRES